MNSSETFADAIVVLERFGKHRAYSGTDGAWGNMTAPWLGWSFVPYLHWVAWIHAGMRANYPWYYVLGALYASPLLFMLATRRVSLVFLLGSWFVSVVHVLLLKHTINQRIADAATAARADETLRQALLHAALQQGGTLSVTQGVMATGKPFALVEHILEAMRASGYVYRRNHPVTGVIEYVFKEVF